MACPKCKSDDWKVASFVHKQGISHVGAHTTTVGISTDDVAVAGSSANGVVQSQLSRDAAPPATGTKKTMLGFWCVVVIVIAWAFSWWLLVLLVPIGLYINKVEPQEKLDDQAAVERWEQTRVCQRCGAFYVP